MIKLGCIKFTDGGIDMGGSAGLVTAALIGGPVGIMAYSANEQRKALKEQGQIQKEAAEQQRKLQEEQAALARKEKADAEAELKAQQLTKRGGRGGLLFGSELGVTDESEQATKKTLG